MDTIEDKLGDSMEKVRIDLLGGGKNYKTVFCCLSNLSLSPKSERNLPQIFHKKSYMYTNITV